MTTVSTYGPHGGNTAEIARQLGVAPASLLDLSASLNPLAPDVATLCAPYLGSLDRYPDDGPATQAVAEAIGVDAERIVLTNGGAEAIALVAQMWPTGRVDSPEFSLYARHLRSVDPNGPRWMSDPHNPTGRLAAADDTAAVRDEAFFPLATGQWTRGDADAIALGSLTKLFACPGLRMGYVLTPDRDSAATIRHLRPRWSVGGLACALIPALLAAADLPGWAHGIAELRRQLAELLASHGFAPATGTANFLWLPHAPGLRDRLLAHGIVVRDGAGFGVPDAVRIAVPHSAGLDRLADALHQSR